MSDGLETSVPEGHRREAPGLPGWHQNRVTRGLAMGFITFGEATRMLLSSVFLKFQQQKPFCVMARGALERMLSATRLDALFESTAVL